MNELKQQEQGFSIDSIPEPPDIENVVFSLMVNPNLSSINYFNDFSEMPVSPEAIGDDNDEIGLFDIDSTGARMAMSTHAFHHHLENDPQTATEILVSRATRKMLCLGVKPIAISAFLYHINYADPNGQTIASGAKKGLERAARKFNLRISDRKIRFDHFSKKEPARPTIIISMIGMAEQPERITNHAFKKKGSNVFLIGRSVDDISSSEYLAFYHGISDSPLPSFDIDGEVKIHEALEILHQQNSILSASPVGKGGLFFTLLRAAIPSGLGFDITTAAETRMDSFLFGEAMGRILVEAAPDTEDAFVDALTEMNIPFFTLGHLTKGEIRIDDASLGYIDKMTPGV